MNYSFSEAGGGKSRCDTYAAIIKRKVTEFVNCGGNASTPHEFATAIASAAGVANVRGLYLYKRLTKETKKLVC